MRSVIVYLARRLFPLSDWLVDRAWKLVLKFGTQEQILAAGYSRLPPGYIIQIETEEPESDRLTLQKTEHEVLVLQKTPEGVQ